MSGRRVIHAPHGSERTCKGWHQEAAMRMLMNNLDPNVAENPDQLVVYGGTRRRPPSWGGLSPNRRAPRRRANNTTLLLPAGEPGGTLPEPPATPRPLL